MAETQTELESVITIRSNVSQYEVCILSLVFVFRHSGKRILVRCGERVSHYAKEWLTVPHCSENRIVSMDVYFFL
jgi:hypothetical protein